MFRDKNDPKKAHFLQCTPRFLAYFRPSFKNSGFQTCVKTRTKGSLRDPRVEKACFMTKRLGEHDAFWLKQDFKPREQSRLVWRPQSTILFRKNSTVCTIEMQIFPKTGARTIDRPYNFFLRFWGPKRRFFSSWRRQSMIGLLKNLVDCGQLELFVFWSRKFTKQRQNAQKHVYFWSPKNKTGFWAFCLCFVVFVTKNGKV